MRALPAVVSLLTGSRQLVAVAALALMVSTPVLAEETRAAPAKNDASAFIEHLGRRVIALLATPKEATKRKFNAFRKIFTSALDMPQIGKQVLGRHWLSATGEQREKYSVLFTEYVVQIYGSQFSNYSGESFEVIKEQSISGQETVVKTRIIRDNGEITHADFRVRRADNRFRVVDVSLRGVSLLVAKRSEFDVIVRRQGLNGLLEQLENRVTQSNNKTDPITRIAKETFRTLETFITFGNPIISKPEPESR